MRFDVSTENFDGSEHSRSFVKCCSTYSHSAGLKFQVKQEQELELQPGGCMPPWTSQAAI